VLTQPLLARARAYQAARGCTLGGALVDLHLISEDSLAPLLEELTGVRAVDPSLMTVYPDFVDRVNALIPPAVVTELLIFPAQMEINTIHVCMLNPTDGWTVRALEAISGCRIVPLVAHEASLVKALQEHYGRAPGAATPRTRGPQVVEAAYRALLETPFERLLTPAVALTNRQRDAIGRETSALERVIRDPAVIRLVQQMICRAIEDGASDIHFEPTGDALRVRARVDGVMRVAHVLPPAISVPVLARLKAMAELPIEASSRPLDGRIAYDVVWARGVDLRFSLVPSITGEKVVLRVLERTRARRALSDLGMDPDTRRLVENASDLPNGLLLVTGPTGSGKTSTLYALLDRLNGDDTCILTAEDPVESRIAGVTQVQCDETAGVGFAAALRSFLRQDPDVLMVGEIRDAETADVALKAALTGHVVLSTLHTNDAPGAVLRLINMRLEPFLVASALRLVVAQRLIRRLCPACRVGVPAGSERGRALARRLGADDALIEGRVLYEPQGCAACNGTGYRGRVGIFEVLRITDRIEELIIPRASAQDIRAQARLEGMRTLRDAGLEKVLQGETSISEVIEHTVAPGAGTGAAQGAAAHV
jgi:type IV pilus assembly protein PilB